MTTAQIYSNNINQFQRCVQAYMKWLGMLLPGCVLVVLRESRELPRYEFCDVELLLVLQPRARLSYMQMGSAPWTCR